MATRQVPLGGSSGLVAIVSESDYERVMKLKWNLGFQGYPKASTPGIGKLHQFILPRTEDVPPKYVVDHANRNILDASKEVLRSVMMYARACTHIRTLRLNWGQANRCRKSP